MSTTEDFRYAPVGATATHRTTGVRAVKLGSKRFWVTAWENYLNDIEMAIEGYILDQPAVLEGDKMNTVEDFENAPVGATATHKATGHRAMKTYEDEWSWVTLIGRYLGDKEMVILGYTLDPLNEETEK